MFERIKDFLIPKRLNRIIELVFLGVETQVIYLPNLIDPIVHYIFVYNDEKLEMKYSSLELVEMSDLIDFESELCRKVIAAFDLYDKCEEFYKRFR